jgi:hypothetical protein
MTAHLELPVVESRRLRVLEFEDTPGGLGDRREV